MFTTLFVYLTLTCIMLLFNALSMQNMYYGLKFRRLSNIPYLSIVCFAIIFGIRYNVGIDHLRYLHSYERLMVFGISDSDYDIGFLYLSKLFAYLQSHYSIFFGFIAFLQLFLLFYALRYHYKQFGWIIFTFMLSTMFLNFMNGIRQEIAFCFQIVSLYYLSERKFYKCYIFILLAILFHISAVVLLPFPLLYLKFNCYFNNVKIQVCLFFIFLISSILLKPAVHLFVFFMQYAPYLGYDNYVNMYERGNMVYLESSNTIGLGFLFLIIMNLINIINSNNVKIFYKSKLFNIIYDFYYVGILYSYLSLGSLVLGRLNYYFYNFSFIVSAFTMYYLRKNYCPRNVLLLIMLIVIYIGLFVAIVVLKGKESKAIYDSLLL